MTVAEANAALRMAVKGFGGSCTQYQIRREIGAVHRAILAKPHTPMELWEPEAYALFYLVKERRLKKLRSRNGKCLSCKLLIMECKCLATTAEYQSIEAGKIHITRSRLDASMDRALDRDVEIYHRAINDFFGEYIAEWHQLRGNDPDAYYGDF